MLLLVKAGLGQLHGLTPSADLANNRIHAGLKRFWDLRRFRCRFHRLSIVDLCHA